MSLQCPSLFCMSFHCWLDFAIVAVLLLITNSFIQFLLLLLYRNCYSCCSFALVLLMYYCTIINIAIINVLCGQVYIIVIVHVKCVL